MVHEINNHKMRFDCVIDTEMQDYEISGWRIMDVSEPVIDDQTNDQAQLEFVIEDNVTCQESSSMDIEQ